MIRALLLALLYVALSAQAEIYRCKASGGATSDQEIPCGTSESSHTMDIPASFPEVNHAERDRLLAREAALEARRLKREEIESRERIARDDRLAREREAEALRDAMLAQQQGVATPLWPSYVVAGPVRPARILRTHPHPLPRNPQRL